MNRYVIKNPGQMWANIANFLFGAEHVSAVQRLSTTFANPDQIFFKTNSQRFVDWYAVELSNYNIKLERVLE